jgi:MraZ protein
VFYGTYHHAIDAKGRTSLPARFRDLLVSAGEPKVFLFKDPVVKRLRALPLSEWKKLEERVLRVSPFDVKAQKIILRTVASAQEIDLDEHGRVLVPAPLRTYAALQKDVVWTGMGRDMCLWDQAVFEQEQAEEITAEQVTDFFKE